MSTVHLLTEGVPSFLLWLGKTSLMASVVVILILGIKTLLRDRLPVKWQYALWLVLIVRLILPWAPESSFSLYNLFPKATNSSTETMFTGVGDYEITSSSFLTEVEEMNGNNHSTGVTASVENKVAGNTQGEENGVPLQQPLLSSEIPWLYVSVFLVWVLGVSVLAFQLWKVNRKLNRAHIQNGLKEDAQMLQYLKECKESMGIKRAIELKVTDRVDGPALIGVIRPRILLPASMEGTFSAKELKYIFLHELVHYKHKDILVNWVMLFLLVVHWFNPVLWYAYRRMREDQELSCDHKAISYVKDSEVKEYGYTIIKLLTKRSNIPNSHLLVTANFSSDKLQIKRRIMMITKFRRKSLLWSVLGLVVVSAFMLVALTNAKADSKYAGLEKEILEMTKQNASLLDNVDSSIRAAAEESIHEMMRHLGKPLPLIEVETVSETNQVFFKFKGDGTGMNYIWVNADTGNLERAIMSLDIPIERLEPGMVERAEHTLQEKGYESVAEFDVPVHRHIKYDIKGLEHYTGGETLGIQTVFKQGQSTEVIFTNGEVYRISFKLPVNKVSDAKIEAARQALSLLNEDVLQTDVTDVFFSYDNFGVNKSLTLRFGEAGDVFMHPDRNEIQGIRDGSIPVTGTEGYSKPRLSYGDEQFRREFSYLAEQLFHIDLQGYDLSRVTKSPGSFTFKKSGERTVHMGINPYGEIIGVSRDEF
ncbi:M56 family metallopeptidase [Paenibacillus gallinarum]|uniref:M56 family metallopeptidase n=1 Tax=Paenibacillus gallinarum TaxID=2762232 RepID=A0ABR8SZ68_9BACL|nr:M56 family metallopeptidase [Paenibacillus gallinarum]MBD7968812.1 M56 family metallopeptidase [Paenibacillus gallinarum]